MKLMAKNLLAIVGAIVTIVAFVALLASNPVRMWVKGHPYPIFIVLVVAILALMVTLNYALSVRRRIVPLVKISQHDRMLYQQFVDRMPVDGTILEWLKNNFTAKAQPSGLFGQLEDTASKLNLATIGFDNEVVERDFKVLKTAIGKFCREVKAYSWEPNLNWIAVRPELLDDTSDGPSATSVIEEARNSLVEAYDEFLATCHNYGVDSGSTGPPQ